MKILREVPLTKGGEYTGVTRVTVDLQPNEKLLVVRSGSHYKLGHPVEDVVASHVISESTQVHWCSASQAWAE